MDKSTSPLSERTTGTVQTAPNVRIHYETYNQHSTNPSQPSLIFHHYYGGSPATFYQVLQSNPSLVSRHVVLYHARGWWPSTGPEEEVRGDGENGKKAYGIKELSADLATVIKATGLSDPEKCKAGYVIVGHSMGGKIAQYYAATAAISSSKSGNGGLRGLILVAPAPLRGIELPPEAKAQQKVAYQSDEGVVFVLDNVLTAKPGTLSPDVMRRCIADSRCGNPAATVAWPTYGAAEDYVALKKQISVPVLVLRGDRDFEREIVGELGVGKGWINKVVEGCGHLIPLEKPARLGEEIEAFLEGLDNSI
ncbi:alpha/beta-hydrolase [Xylariaceae sp. FL0255]|nr:alpha/beta-hydrolase [Xylariaceae sp. FL0255]